MNHQIGRDIAAGDVAGDRGRPETRQSRTVIRALLILLAVAWAAPALAQEAEPPPAEPPATADRSHAETELKNLELFFGDNVVVSVPSTREVPLHLAPAPVLVVTASEIRARGYRHLSDLLHDLPGVDYASNISGEWSTAVLFRGIEANNRVLILRDGVPITFPAGTLFVFGRNLPLYDVERVEVLYGPASAVYGGDAFAAVIQLITQDPADGPLAEVQLSGGAFDPLASYGRSIGAGHAHFSWAASDLSIAAGVETYQTDGPDLLAAYPDALASIQELPEPYTGVYEAPVRAWNAHMRARYSDVQLGAYYTDHAWSASAGYNPGPPYDYAFVEESIWRYQHIQAFALHEARRGAFDLRTVGTFGHLRLHPETAFHDFGDVFYKYADESALRIDHRTVWFAHPRLDLTAGMRAQAINAVPRSPDLPEPIDTTGSLRGHDLDHVIFARYGAFTLVDYRPLDDLLLTGGLSYEHVGNSRENVLLPRAGLVLNLLGGEAYLKALYAEAFVPPSPRLQYQRYTIPGEFAFLPNPELGSERLRSAQLVYGQRLHAWVQLEVATYYNHASGIVQQVVVGSHTTPDGTFFPESEQNRNLGSLWTAGGESVIRFGPNPRLQVFASYAYVTGEEELPTNGGVLTDTRAKIANHKLVGGVTAWLLPRLSLDVRLRWVGEVQTRATNSLFQGDPMPGYANLNANLRWVDAVPGLDLHVRLENVTDARYYHFSPTVEGADWQPRIPQPGLRFLAGLTWRFGQVGRGDEP